MINGERVKELRIQKGFSQEELARRIGLHQTAIGFIERNEKGTSLPAFARLCDALGASADELLCTQKSQALVQARQEAQRLQQALERIYA